MILNTNEGDFKKIQTCALKNFHLFNPNLVNCRPDLRKISCGVFFSEQFFSFVIGDQIRRILAKLKEATSTDVLNINRIQPTYIYIEDPFFQEEISADLSLGKERLKLPKFHRWLSDKIEESFIFRNLFSFKKNLAWRYLQLAQDENQSYRFRAIRSLASLINLNDADYQQLAQACDVKTAVGLARTAAHVKFLLDPPYFKMKPDKKSIVRHVYNLFLNLDPTGKHPCLQYFVSKVILSMTEFENKDIDDDEFRVKFDKRDFVPLCLEALLHHSWIDENAREIVKLGGLPLLIEVYKDFKQSNPENVDSVIVLSKLLANISALENVSNEFFESGWIKVLAILAQHRDIRVSAPAQKALANLDEDDFQKLGGTKYLRSIYPLYPSKRTISQPKLDVIFIHGLLGEIFVTWRRRDAGHCSHKSPLELLGITSEDDRIYEETKPIDQDFFVDVAEMHSWEKISDSYEFVLADIPIESNSMCTGPFYGSPRDIDCEKEDNFTKCWPRDWLPQDCPKINLLGINYETNISKWTPLCPVAPSRKNYFVADKLSVATLDMWHTGGKGSGDEGSTALTKKTKSSQKQLAYGTWNLATGTIMNRSELMLRTLIQAGVGKRPIVWVGHSMGGLIVKGVLSLAEKSSDPITRSLYEQTRGIVFYSTPHKGSRLAALTPASQIILWPSVEVQELRENSPQLLKLHEEFLNLIKNIPVQIISFAERDSTYITALKFELRFVDAYSADPDVGEVYGIPLDHLSICKPSGRQSFLYQKVKKLIQEILNEDR